MLPSQGILLVNSYYPYHFKSELQQYTLSFYPTVQNMITFSFWHLIAIVLVHHGASEHPGGLSKRHLTIAGEYWDPYLLIEDNPDGTEEYRVVNQTGLGHILIIPNSAGMARIQTAEITFENVAICCSSKRASLE